MSVQFKSREHAAAMGLAAVWDEQVGQRDNRPPAAATATPKRRGTVRNDLGQNKTEARYDNHLSDLKAVGQVRDYAFESFKFRLAGRTWLTPDFAVWMPDDRLIVIDVKGWLEDDAAVKVKVLAEMRPRLAVYLVSLERNAWVYRSCGRGGIRLCASPFA